MPKALVQIGLYRSCEYIYVTEPSPDMPNRYALPHEVADWSDEWHYYGVDMMVESIDFCRKQYAHNPKAHFIRATVYNKNMSHVTGLWKDESGIVGLDDIFDQIAESVEVLVMDTENSEVEILRSYSWQHYPSCIILECHTLESFNVLMSVLTDKGYTLLENVDTNQGYTKQLTWLHMDVVSEKRIREWAGAGLAPLWGDRYFNRPNMERD